jgi:tetratricopeptide (TPR) repeat protein
MQRILLAGALLLAIIAPCLVVAQDDGPWRAAMLEGMNAAGVNNYSRAEQALLRAVHLAEAFGPKDPRTGSTLNSLGLVYRAEHKYAEAESAYRRALPIMEAAYGTSLDVANVNYNLATVLLDMGHQAMALPSIDRALEIYIKLLGDSSLKTADMLCMKGDAYRLMKRLADAEGPLRRCADIREKNNGLESAELADALLSLARVLAAEGKDSAAEVRYQLVEKIREKTVGITSPVLAESMDEHAAVLKSLGRDKEAERLTAMSASIRKAQGSKTPAK